MAVESATYTHELDPTKPDGAVEYKYEGDDHLRLIKQVEQNTWPNISGRVEASQSELNLLDGFTYLGSAAARDAGGTEGTVCLIGSVSGTPSLPALDGSRLTGVVTTDALISEIQLQQLADGWFVGYYLSQM